MYRYIPNAFRISYIVVISFASRITNERVHCPSYLYKLVINIWAMVIIAIFVVPPPIRERVFLPTSAKDGKTQNEEHDQARAVKRSCDQVGIVPEDDGEVVAEVELDEESRDDPAEDDARLSLV